MMNQIEEIKRALEEVDVSTARGRRTLHGKQINVEPSKQGVANAAMERACNYKMLMDDLRSTAEHHNTGMPEVELECVEMLMEQLEGLYRKAVELHIANM